MPLSECGPMGLYMKDRWIHVAKNPLLNRRLFSGPHDARLHDAKESPSDPIPNITSGPSSHKPPRMTLPFTFLVPVQIFAPHLCEHHQQVSNLVGPATTPSLASRVPSFSSLGPSPFYNPDSPAGAFQVSCFLLSGRRCQITPGSRLAYPG